MKKRLSLCMLSVLLLMLALTGRASGSTVITGRADIPDVIIDVVVPAEAESYINPKKLPVLVGTGREFDQILSEPCYIQNKSEVPVQVDIQLCGNLSGSARLVNTSTVGTGATAKNIFMYFEMLAVNDTASYVPWLDTYDPDRHLVVLASSKSYTNVVLLGADGEEKCYGAFRLTGDCIEEPKYDWNSKDGVTVNITFTFKARPIGTEIP